MHKSTGNIRIFQETGKNFLTVLNPGSVNPEIYPI
jgi:hypothetical protein